MSDGRKNNGCKSGENRGQGRKPKADEVELIERLSPMDDLALQKLKEGVNSGDFKFIQLFMNYRYGRPKEKKDITSNGETLNFGSIDWFKSDEAE